MSKITFFCCVRSLLLLAALSLTAFSQSTEQQFPTPVLVSEIAGSINPRQIGDSRTTTYFYTFNGSQGDLFLNILSTNLNADIDLFIEQGLRPLTKIAVYADRGDTETGRVIYLRKPEKLLLRVQGRSPNDDPGKFRFKFAGGFVAAASDSPLPPDLPKVPETIVAEIRPTPADIKSDDDEKKGNDSDGATEKTEIQSPSETEKRNVEIVERSEPETDEPKKTPKVVLTDPVGEVAGKKSSDAKERETPENRSRAESARETARRERDEARLKKKKPDPMAAFSLVIVFRDGSRIERPMTEVSRFAVDKGTLTVVNKGGQTGRYSMADVVSVTVQ
jgi:hypothetical protein